MEEIQILFSAEQSLTETFSVFDAVGEQKINFLINFIDKFELLSQDQRVGELEEPTDRENVKVILVDHQEVVVLFDASKFIANIAPRLDCKFVEVGTDIEFLH